MYIEDDKKEYELQQTLYEMYKAKWMEGRITADMILDECKNYYEAITEVPGCYSCLDEYIFDNGYAGTIYVCFDEFCNSEYLNKEYMYELIGDCKSLKEAYDVMTQ